MYSRSVLVVGFFALLAFGAAFVTQDQKDGHIKLSVGDVVTAGMRKQDLSGWVEITLRDNETSVSQTLFGANAEGALQYAALWNCTTTNFKCAGAKEVKADGWQSFPAGEVLLVVARRPDELAVWLPRSPQHAATVPTQGLTNQPARLRMNMALNGYAGTRVNYTVVERSDSDSPSIPNP